MTQWSVCGGMDGVEGGMRIRLAPERWTRPEKANKQRDGHVHFVQSVHFVKWCCLLPVAGLL